MSYKSNVLSVTRDQKQSLVIVSNRLPLAIESDPSGLRRLVPGTGGLVTALGPVLQDRGGRWVGSLGTSDDGGGELEGELAEIESQLGYRFDPVSLDAEEIKGFYEGFANEVLWPLFHDFISNCNFDPSYWPIYREANRKFARATARSLKPSDYVWIHDYHLMLVAKELAELGVKRDIGFFLHIPFPQFDMFAKLPWRQQIIEALLEYTLIGLQAQRDVDNFLDCIRHLVPNAVIEDAGSLTRIRVGNNVTSLRAFPISIDYDDFLQRSVEDSVSELVARIRTELPGRKLILGLDRLDYSKGIPYRIRAFGLALERFPELRGKVTLLQVVIPSRTMVNEYRHLKDEIDRLVGMVNGEYARDGWIPIHYQFRALPPVELLGYYRASDVALVTPLKDGMNLVAKEYCACSLEDEGVLILSEFAGAAPQLADGAFLVNPFDLEQVGDAIHQAVTISDDERRRRMKLMRQSIRKENIYAWVEGFLAAASAARQTEEREEARSFDSSGA